MRILHVVPTYPGDPFDGSAVYERALHRALRELGAEVEVFATRTARPVAREAFALEWPNELPRRDEHEGVPITRFDVVNTTRHGTRMSTAILRRWSREDTAGGIVAPGSVGYVRAMTERARRRPARYDALADLGRGPVAPALVARVARDARRFDVVLAGYAPFSLPRHVLAAVAPSRTPVALLPFIHETDRYHHFGTLYRTYERAAVVLTLSAHTARYLEEHVPGARAVAIGAGVDPERRQAGEAEGEAFRARHDLRGSKVMLFVGRKEGAKRYDLALDALDRLPGDVVLVMVGKDVDERPVRSSRVRMLGVVSDDELAAAYRACDLLIFPSEHESFGMVTLEAWLHGKPVLANARCGASSTLMDHGVDGLLCSDGEEFAQAAARVLADPGLAARLGAAGRRKVLAGYTWQHVGARALAALHEVRADAAGSRA